MKGSSAIAAKSINPFKFMPSGIFSVQTYTSEDKSVA